MERRGPAEPVGRSRTAPDAGVARRPGTSPRSSLACASRALRLRRLTAPGRGGPPGWNTDPPMARAISPELGLGFLADASGALGPSLEDGPRLDADGLEVSGCRPGVVVEAVVDLGFAFCVDGRRAFSVPLSGPAQSTNPSAASASMKAAWSVTPVWPAMPGPSVHAGPASRMTAK